MKKIFTIILSSVLLFSLSSCDSLFDKMEGDLSKMTGEDMLSSDAGIQRILANLYTYLPVGTFSTSDQNTLFANHSRSTPSYGMGGVSSFWSYGDIRKINKFIKDLDNALEKGVITEGAAKAYKGEALAIRAYCYFASVRRYGGIPIVEEPLDDKYDGGENLGLYFPRLTEKESWDWVLDQFQQAADMLPESLSGRTHGINKYVALGLKARAALWAASESKYWNRAPITSSYNAVQKKLTYMEASYANAYYQQAIDAAAAVINSNKYSLYGAKPGSVADAAKNLEDLFQAYRTEEGMLGVSYNNGNSSSGNGTDNWTAYQYINKTAYLVGGYSATLNIADEYDYYASATDRSSKPGKIATKTSGNEDYFYESPELDVKTVADVAEFKRYDRISEPFELKDARFQAWFIYPGTTFRGEVANIQGGMVTPDGAMVYPDKNPSYKLGETTYYAYGADAAAVYSSAFYDLINDVNSNNRSFYSFMIRKFMDANGYNPTPKTPWYDLRYAEVLLTYAEAVAESKLGDAALAAKCLNDVRHRAGFTDDIALTVDNVLHEWKVEFPFENKWSSVLYRRRAFYNTQRTEVIPEENDNEKYILIPMIDLTGSTPKYIFLRAIPYPSSSAGSFNFNGILEVRNNESYYSQVPNYVNNRFEENNK